MSIPRLLTSSQNHGGLKSTSKVQAAQTMEAPKATVQLDAHSQNPNDSEDVDSPPRDALSPDWDNRDNVDNPLNWSRWWKIRYYRVGELH